ncbi:MAG TPA: N-acetylmuramoyl-L-alanine amidase, partial [Trueperaceae bacterium]
EGNPHLQDLWYGIIGGKLALVADTSFELSAGGRGYRYDVLPPEQDGQDARLYVDLGPTLQGEPVTTLAATPRPLPAQAAAPEPQARQVALRRTPKPTIVLDPGHGGKFAGARGIGGIKEEVLVLQIAFKVKALLESRGYKVVMTRTTDTQLSLNYDEDLVSRANFATAERNLFVSIHANTAANPAGHGIETYVFGKPLNNDTLKAAIRENGGGDDNVGRAVTDTALAFATGLDGDLLAQEILHFSRMLAQSVQSSLVAGTGAGDRGVKQAPYRVLTQSRIPAILVEVGFMTNPTEGPKLVQDSYQDKIAAGIARGIFSFFESNGSVAAR